MNAEGTRVPAPAGHRRQESVSGGESLRLSLEAVGCEVVFGIPGGAILPAYDHLMDSRRIRHVLVRHEQGAGHAAAGYAQATGEVGVCVATSGPGAINLATALADAYVDSVPVVAITGQVPRGLIGRDGFQEADVIGVTMPICKHSFQVTDPAEIPRVVAAAFHIAATGRPGPVVVDIPKDVLQETTSFRWPPELRLRGYRPVPVPDWRRVHEAAQLISTADRPVLYVGGGVLKSGASEEVLRLAESTRVPVVTTLMARGAFPDSHPLHLGMPGMHGTVAAVAAMQRSDLLIAVGARFDDRVTGRLDSFAPDSTVVHIDIDPAELSKNRRADVPIVGDCRAVLAELADTLRGRKPPELRKWWDVLEGIRTAFPLGYEWPADGTLSPQYVIERIGEITGPDALYVAGVGQHQMWAAQFIRYERPGSWINSGGLGTMGFAVPAAMGVKVARPETTVWCIDGDGCFQMTNQELATCAVEHIPIKVALINNGSLGMVRQWQDLFYDGRYSNTDLGTHKHRVPDFAALAESLGCAGLRCESPDEVNPTIAQAMAIDDRPVVIDFVVGRDAQVWPMVPSGTGNDMIMAARDIRPLFGDADDDAPTTRAHSAQRFG